MVTWLQGFDEEPDVAASAELGLSVKQSSRLNAAALLTLTLWTLIQTLGWFFSEEQTTFGGQRSTLNASELWITFIFCLIKVISNKYSATKDQKCECFQEVET